MRGKRSKQYRKLMQQYILHFSFREPYQVLLDSQILEDAARFKMDLTGQLEKALHGTIKPMLTTCSIRHLASRHEQSSAVMVHARDFERRRCNHHTLAEPLSEFDCISQVVDPNGSRTNKHKLVVASQDETLRAKLRTIPGVPMVYIKRSVMVMEPMGGATEEVRAREERGKFRLGLKGARGGPERGDVGLKRKREDEDDRIPAVGGNVDVVGEISSAMEDRGEDGQSQKPKKRKKGPSGPNPLAVKKAKPKHTANAGGTATPRTTFVSNGVAADQESVVKKKRQRRHKASQAADNATIAIETAG